MAIGNAVITQCLGKIAEINEFSAFDEMLSDEADRTSAGRLLDLYSYF